MKSPSMQAVMGRRTFTTPTIVNLFRYRWLIAELVSRDLRLRYRGSIIGFLWTLLNPVLFMAVYTLVFGLFLHVGTSNYPVYLLSGLVPWSWLSMSIMQGTTSIQDGRMYVGKVLFPAEILIAVPLLSNMINFLLSLPLLFAVGFALGVKPGWSVLLLPVVIAVQFLLTYGALLIIATYNVFFRDLQQLTSVVLTLLFHLNPIFYTLDRIPETVRPYVAADPTTPIITAYQDILYSATWPSLLHLGYSACAAILIYFIGQMVFNRHRDAFAEYL